MSYDLAVFDPELAPVELDEFLNWYREQTSWSKSIDYDDPTNLSPCLSDLFYELIKTFPPMNGPLKVEGDSPNKTDYCCDTAMIYAGFTWSQAGPAYSTMRELAGKHQCGFFDVSSIRGTVWIPSDEGGLSKHPSIKPWWKFW